MERTEAGVPAEAWLEREGPWPRPPDSRLASPACQASRSGTSGDDLADVTTSFNASEGHAQPFNTAGVMHKGSCGRPAVQRQRASEHWGTCSCRLKDDDVTLDPSSLERPKGWTYLKAEEGVQAETLHLLHNGILPVALDRPSRTIITGEGDCSFCSNTSSPSVPRRSNANGSSRWSRARSWRTALTTAARLRRLVPVELERLNGFLRSPHRGRATAGGLSSWATHWFAVIEGIAEGSVRRASW